MVVLLYSLPMDRKIYSVTELNRLVKTTLENEIGSVWVEGEVSNLRRPSSGHLYFTLKDAGGQISIVLFRGSQRGVPEVADGRKLRVCGDMTAYVERGNYQLIARIVEEAGKGSLQEAFEKLKARLQEEGLFDADRKKSLPTLARHIGIVTSQSGAAIRDLLNVLTRRFPNLHVVLAPVKVQGDGAAEEIANAIDTLNRRSDLDLLIIGRGGGSLEDLWAFNEETVARAIARSALPVISAVGHEIDFTISDFVADVRAPTPSAAAELAVEPLAQWQEQLATLQRRLAHALHNQALTYQNRFIRASRSYVFREPQNLLRQYRKQVDSLQWKLSTTLKGAARGIHQQIDEIELRMTHRITSRVEKQKSLLERRASELNSLNPTRVLQRGYSITRDPSGKVIDKVALATPGQPLVTLVSDGHFTSTVDTITPSPKEP
ncbi:MAG: exodeoxyribonuclease VII large subunit [Kiritimatiellae bacterium]|nr:exodeoxyribonuclease VII large subunit [Kiritimatiellia bacterium]